jgi:hypothetical protein
MSKPEKQLENLAPARVDAMNPEQVRGGASYSFGASQTGSQRSR